MSKLKGDVAVVIDGETWKLRYSGAAFMALEDMYDGKPFTVILKDLKISKAEQPDGDDASADQEQAQEVNLGMRDAAKLVRAGLLRNHPDVSLEDAADLILAPGMMDAMGRAMAAAFPRGGDGNAARGPRVKSSPGTGT